jgi:hypothetical protein
VFFVSADAKELVGGSLVSAESARFKEAVFSMAWEWLGSADSKEVKRAVYL